MFSKLRIIVTGLIAQYPLGGVTWDYIQYVQGLAGLGHDVYYFEDTGVWPYNPIEGGVAENCIFNVEYLASAMSRFGLENKWAYRFPWQSQWFGLPDTRRTAILQSADLLINISGSLGRPDNYRHIPQMVYIDSDPVFTQLKLALGQLDFCNTVNMHDVHFSFGESLSSAIPTTGQNWLPTRQPIVLSMWRPSTERREVFTTVMNWTSYKDLHYEGRTYGQKDIEFKRFFDLPQIVEPTILELAVNVGNTRRTPHALLKQKGWRLVDPQKVCADLDGYRMYVETSKAEWSVAKNGYVLGQPGWFSCRSACYLAAGRPVVVQDTGFSSILPVGEGLLPFKTVEEAAAAIHEVEAAYPRHSRAARSIAEEYFDHNKVLTELIDRAMASQ